MDLKNACKHKCKKASSGRHNPMVVIIKPNWLSVE